MRDNDPLHSKIEALERVLHDLQGTALALDFLILELLARPVRDRQSDKLIHAISVTTDTLNHKIEKEITA